MKLSLISLELGRPDFTTCVNLRKEAIEVIPEERKQVSSPVSVEFSELRGDCDVDIVTNLAGALEQIVTATDREVSTCPSDQKLKESFHAVARKFSDKDLCVEPVLASLVNAATGRFAALSIAQQESMSRAVAATLYEDAESRLRLERLWHQLRGEV